jgi:hypothetical protein
VKPRRTGTFFVAKRSMMVVTGVETEGFDPEKQCTSIRPSLETGQLTGTEPLREQPRTTRKTQVRLFSFHLITGKRNH